MTSRNSCPQCGAPLPPEYPSDHCPRCLLELALVDEASRPQDGDQTTKQMGSESSSDCPDKIGPYRILEVLGEGGMGVVYLAEQQEPIRRRVALKVIKVGMDTKEVIARFESERQALALMNHRNIAKVLDAGSTEQGRPYFVMEYVAGVPITEYCDKHRLNTQDRLQLFIRTCDAFQHAHQKGIIHRDIKPSNVLVEIQEDKPAPKVIDFGVAKAINQRLTEKTLFTQHGVLIGTPSYMSPEQAEMSPLDIDTRTDIYSLGVLLYELLVGVPPFEAKVLRKAGYDEMRRIIREVDPPTLTSRLTNLGDTVNQVAEHRHTDPSSLARQLRGDLDWITLKALDKDRTRRYPSASEMAADIARHLADEPVVASPPNRLYRLHKAFARNRGSFIAVALIFVALALGLSFSTFFFLRSEQARAEVLRESYRANITAADFYLKAHDVAGARQRLAACEPSLRGWEWKHLRLKTDSSLATFDVGGPAKSLAFSSDGSEVFWLLGVDDESFGEPLWLPAGHSRLLALNTRTLELTPQTQAQLADPRESQNPPYIIAFNQDASRVASTQTVPTWRGRQPSGSAVAQFPAGQPKDSLYLTDRLSGQLITQVVVPNSGVWAGETPARTSYSDHHGFWYLLNSSLDPVARLSWPHVISASFSPNPGHVVAWSWDNVLRMFDTDSGRALTMMKGHEDGITSVAFTPNGKLMASASFDGTVRLWDVTKGEGLAVLRGHDGSVLSLAFSPDGSKIVSGSQDKTVRLWNVKSRQVVHVLRGHDEACSAVAFSPDGKRIVSGSGDATLRLWDAVSGEILSTFLGHHRMLETPGSSLEPFPDLDHGRQAPTFLSTEDTWNSITAVAFSRDGERIVSGAVDETIRLWDAGLDNLVSKLSQDGLIVAAKASPTGRRIVFSLIQEFDLFEDRQARGAVVVWDSVSNTIKTLWQGNGAWSVALSPDGTRVVVGLSDRTLSVLETTSGRVLLTLSGHKSEVGYVTFTPDGMEIVSASDDDIRVWDATSGKHLSTLQGIDPDQEVFVALSPDGRRLAVATSGQTIQLWDKSSGRVLLTMDHDNSLSGVVFSSDGKRILTGSEEGSAWVWDAISGEQLGELTGHNNAVRAIAFSQDGRRVVTGSVDTTVRVWEPTSFELLLTLDGHEKEVTSVAFSPDGSQIISASVDGTIKVWKSQ